MHKYYLVLGVCIFLSGCASNLQMQENTKGNQDDNTLLTAKVEDVNVKTHDVVATLSLFNHASETLNITKVSGTCSCFTGYSGGKVIKPGEKGQIEVYFDKNKLASGHYTKKVRIETDNPKQPVQEVELAFTVNRTAEEEDRWFVRKELANLHKEIQLLRNEIGKGNPEIQKQKPQAPADTKVYSIDIGNSPVLGPKDAPVTIAAFFDLQCPYCIREYPKIKQILSEYPNKVRFVIKHYPLNFHKQAPAAHAALLLALDEKGADAYWKMLEMIIDKPKNLSPEELTTYARAFGLDMEIFKDVLENEGIIKEILKEDLSLGNKYNVRGTPTIFVNGLKLQDRTLEGYRKRINNILGIALAN